MRIAVRFMFSGLTGMLMTLYALAISAALWDVLWPYIALCGMAVVTFIMWAALDVVYRVWNGLIESHPVEVSGRVPVTALNSYGRTAPYKDGALDSIARNHEWQRAYEQALLIAHFEGGSFSFGVAQAHISDSPRAYWEWMKAELEKTNAIRLTEKGYRLTDDYRVIRAKWHGGILPRPRPCPGRDAPMLRL